MLEVSSAAAAAILAATEGQSGAGLRVRIADTTEQGAELQVSITDQPGPGDQVVGSEAGAAVFVEPAAALYLTDKVLDAHQDAEGKVHFTFHGKI